MKFFAQKWMLLSAVLCLAPHAALAETDKAPDWARNAMHIAVPVATIVADREINAVVLLREDTLTVNAAGRGVVYHREVRKILRPQGKEFGTVGIAYDAHSKVEFLHVWTIHPDGQEFSVRNRDIVDYGESEWGMLYVDDHVKKATAVAVEPDSVVAFEYQQKLQPYLTTEVFDLQENNLPVLQQRILLALPPGAEFTTAWKHHVTVTPNPLSDNSWQWEIAPLPAIRHEPLAPARRAARARMLLSFSIRGARIQSGAWKAVGGWFEQLSAGRDEGTPEIAAKVATLIAGKPDFMSKVLAITGFMQDEIRYVGIEVGVGGWQPHAASAVFAGRYGDCKDKATLLIAMLRDAGVEAHYVLVDSDRGFMIPEFASQFSDHMITAIAVPAGLQDARLQSVVISKEGKRWLIFDPTQAVLPAGQLENYLQGGYGLLIDGASTQLLPLPVVDAAQSEVKLSGHFQLSADGALSGTLDEEYRGPKALNARYLFGSGDLRLEREAIKESLRDAQISLALQSFEVENVSDRNKNLMVHCKVSASAYAKQAGRFLLVRPRVTGSDVAEVDLDHPRVAPVQFGSVHTQTDDFTIDLPAGYAVDDLPDPTKLDTEFATYTSKTTATGNQIHYVRTYQVRELEVPAHKYKEFADFMQQIANDESNAVFLKQAH